MIRFRLAELLADYRYRTGKRLTLVTLASKTKIHRTTLSKIAGQKGYNTTTENIDRLCAFFDCPIEKLVEYVPDRGKR